MQEPQTISFTAWTADGFKSYLCFRADGPEQAMQVVRHAAAMGWLAREPGVEPGEADGTVDVECMIRHEYIAQDGQTKRFVAFYAPLRGKGGIFKWTKMWINDNDNGASVKLLLDATGVNYWDMPLVRSKAESERIVGHPQPHEVAPKKPCKVVREATDQKMKGNDGQEHTTYKFSRLIPAGGAAGPAPVSQAPQSTPPGAQHGAGLAQMLKNVGAVTDDEKDVVIQFVTNGKTLEFVRRGGPGEIEDAHDRLAQTIRNLGQDSVLAEAKAAFASNENIPF